MKNLYRILIALLAFSFIAVSCKDKEYEYIPGEQDVAGCYGVYFPTQDASGSHVYDPNMDRSVAITVSRTNSSGAINVPYTVTSSEEGVFNFGTINFADGQTETELVVTFPNAKVGVDYSFSVQIEDNQYASLYNEGAIALDFSVLIVEMKTFKTEDGKADAKVTFTDMNFLEEVHKVDLNYYEVDGVRYCETSGGETIYSGNGLSGSGPFGTDVQLKFKWYTNRKVTVDDVEYDWIEVEPSNTGFTSSNRPIYMGDYFHMRADMGLSNGNYADSYERYTKSTDGYLPSYYDGHGGFIFNAAYWIHGTTSWYGYKNSTPVAIAEGYLRVDYSLDLYPDYTQNGVTPIDVEAGVDVANIKYAVYEGELTATQVGYKIEAITAGTEEGVVTFSDFEIDEEEAVKYATLGVEMDKTAEYTIVAVAYDDKGKPQNNASATFRHIAAGDTEEYAVDINVLTEATPVRYTETGNYDQYTSFAFAVYGSDITVAHLAVVRSTQLSNSLLSTLKYSDDYAVSEDVLAKINGEGGYYDVASGLAANTEYAVVVWATNGSEDKFVYETFKTEKLPYVWNSLGKGQLTDDVMTLFDEEDNPLPPYTVSCDVFEEASTPGLYMITGYQLPLVAQIFGATEEALAQYEGTYWKNTELIIDATDPEKVFIESQEYGCRISSDGWMWVSSIYNGKHFSEGSLKDGVITFPTKGMLCGFDGAIRYYANMNGAFKLVFNSSASQTSAPANASSTLPEKTYTFKGRMAQLPAVGPMKFERDAQAVNAKVSVSYDRNAKAGRALRESRISTVK